MALSETIIAICYHCEGRLVATFEPDGYASLGDNCTCVDTGKASWWDTVPPSVGGTR